MGALFLGHHDILIYEMKIGVKMLFAEEEEDKKEKEETEETEEKEEKEEKG